MIEFCDLKQCEECEKQYSSTYMYNDTFCLICWDILQYNLSTWIKWEIQEGGEDND